MNTELFRIFQLTLKQLTGRLLASEGYIITQSLNAIDGLLEEVTFLRRENERLNRELNEVHKTNDD